MKINNYLSKITEIVISEAKNELLPRFSKISHQHKVDGSIVTEADLVVQKNISYELFKLFPDFKILGEEMSPEQQTKSLMSGESVWCLDPLDGTSNFAFGIPYFAVSLALIQNGKVQLGIVYDPVRDECFTATENEALLNNSAISVSTHDKKLNQSTAIIDFKRLSKTLATKLITEPPYSSQRNFGASALDWCWLAMGRGHVYLHGSQNIWDYAAGQFIFEKSGGFSQTIEGEDVFKCALEKRSVVAAINLALFNQWTMWMKESTKTNS